MSLTKQEVKEIAPNATLPGYTSGAGTVVSSDTIKQALQKIDGNVQQVSSQLSVAAVGNNLFNYYNFK